MKFEIRKRNNRDTKPCEEAVLETKIISNNMDVRRIDSPYKIWTTEEEVQKNWFGIGKNHRVVNGKIMRDMEDIIVSYWVIEFDSLEELVAFQSKYGEIIISDFSTKSSLKVIEIKDE